MPVAPATPHQQYSRRRISNTLDVAPRPTIGPQTSLATAQFPAENASCHFGGSGNDDCQLGRRLTSSDSSLLIRCPWDGPSGRIQGMQTMPPSKMSLAQSMTEFSPFCGDVLFEALPDVQFFVKDLQGRYVKVNQSLKDNYLMTGDQEILGKTDHELFPHYLADNFVRDDKLVLRGALIQNRIELVGRYNGTATWSITTKSPLRVADGSIIGLAGTTRDMGKTSSTVRPFQQLDEVTSYIEENFCEKIPLSKLAELVNLSVRSLQRRFHSVFRITPSQYIARIRIINASKLLATTDTPIAAVADMTGFSDQSHFTRTFVNAVGKTPRSYRTQYRPTGERPA